MQKITPRRVDAHLQKGDRQRTNTKRNNTLINMRKNIILLLLAGLSLSVGAEKVKKVKIVYNDGTANLSIDRSKVNKIIFTEEWPEEQIFTIDGVTFKMIKVEKGEFQMGSTDEQAYDDEQPVHKVILTKDYYIGQTEVTQALYKAVMGSNPSSITTSDQLPVEQVSYNDITGTNGFLATLNAKIAESYTDETFTFRLPTEAEWEFAARGGNKSQGYTYSGSNTIDDVSWYKGNSSDSTHEVAKKAPNELGLYDMSGNVYEWCSDWYGAYSSEAQTDPTGAGGGYYRVYRSGSWRSIMRFSRSSYRSYGDSDDRGSSLGLRLCLSAE